MTENRGEVEDEAPERTEAVVPSGPMPGSFTGAGLLIPGTKRAYLRCAYCLVLWDPGAFADCPICKAYPPKKGGKERVSHGAHQMCLTCWSVYRKARRREAFDRADTLHVRRNPDLRFKLQAERILPPMKSDDEGDRTTA